MIVYIYLKLTEVREIVEMSNLPVAGHEAAAGDARERGRDVGKRGQAVHPWQVHLETGWVNFRFVISRSSKSMPRAA